MCSLKRLLHGKADSFLSNDYYESDIAWMELVSVHDDELYFVSNDVGDIYFNIIFVALQMYTVVSSPWHDFIVGLNAMFE